MNCCLCERFPGLTPFEVRRERFHEVILIFSRLMEKSNRESNKKDIKSGVIRIKANNDNWY